MVLNGRQASRGVSLLELLIAISLSGFIVTLAMALYKDVGMVARLTQGRSREAFQGQAVFSALAENIGSGNGILRLGPGELDLLNREGRKVEYRWADSTLTVNGKAWPFRLAELQFEPYGPPMLVREGFQVERVSNPALDTLDEDRDGIIEFRELDRDGNGWLETQECAFISQIRIRFTTLKEGIPFRQTCVLHPRNHAPLPLEGEIAPGSGYF